ncbi:hypothetical protein SAMN05444370_1794, partial [Rubrimonas cliftonensis]
LSPRHWRDGSLQLFDVTCGREELVRDLPLRRLPQTLPIVLSQEEVAALLTAGPGPGLKYRAALEPSRTAPGCARPRSAG